MLYTEYLGTQDSGNAPLWLFIQTAEHRLEKSCEDGWEGVSVHHLRY